LCPIRPSPQHLGPVTHIRRKTAARLSHRSPFGNADINGVRGRSKYVRNVMSRIKGSPSWRTTKSGDRQHTQTLITRSRSPGTGKSCGRRWRGTLPRVAVSPP
jgi:hypothetical protein